jgi:hypothetical protein
MQLRRRILLQFSEEADQPLIDELASVTTRLRITVKEKEM